MSSLLTDHIIPLPLLTKVQFANFCGITHQNIQLLESFFNTRIHVSPQQVLLKGIDFNRLMVFKIIFGQLIDLVNHPISLFLIRSLLEQSKSMNASSNPLMRKTIIARNEKQAQYLKSIEEADIIFAVGPAGTGKTYLAVSKAVELFEKGEVQRLVFVRPAVEAGEKLGFLPGDLVEKVLPYLRPIYDALFEMLGVKETQKLLQRDIIEILPLAFMRGRTLNEAFIILDEAQNTTISQMKMFLTRMGFGSKMIINGDMTQVDLPKETKSGLQHAVKLLASLPSIRILTFSNQEVVRHPLITEIINCYDHD